MIGLRVVDVGLLVAFLVWFFRLRDDDDGQDDGGGGGGPERGPHDDPGGGGTGLRIGAAKSSARRVRDHARRPGPLRRRGGEPVRRPLPARVRRPSPRVPVHRTR